MTILFLSLAVWEWLLRFLYGECLWSCPVAHNGSGIADVGALAFLPFHYNYIERFITKAQPHSTAPILAIPCWLLLCIRPTFTYKNCLVLLSLLLSVHFHTFLNLQV